MGHFRGQGAGGGDLDRRDYPKIASAWLASDRERTLEALGQDPWTYGLEPNRTALETLLRYAQADGLTSGLLQPEALFHAPAAVVQAG